MAMNGLLKGSNEEPFNGQVFYIENNTRRWMSSVDCIEAYDFAWPDDVEWVSSSELSVYIADGEMPLPWLDKTFRINSLKNNIDATNTVGLEIGALAKPVITKDEGRIYYADYTTTEQLKEYSVNDPNVDISKIVDIDFIWGEKTLRESIPQNMDFDYVIASHVIEHVPDVIGWLNEIQEVLKIGGTVSLAIPDKRYTFDYFRKESTVAELIDAYLNRYRRPSTRQIFDHYSNAVNISVNDAWDKTLSIKDVELHHSDELAYKLSLESLDTGRYIDCHCSVFTCDRFIEILEKLFRLNLLNFKVNVIYRTKYYMNEFIVIMEKLPPMDKTERLEIQLKSLCEISK